MSGLALSPGRAPVLATPPPFRGLASFGQDPLSVPSCLGLVGRTGRGAAVGGPAWAPSPWGSPRGPGGPCVPHPHRAVPGGDAPCLSAFGYSAMMLQGTPVISGRKSVDAAFAFDGETLLARRRGSPAPEIQGRKKSIGWAGPSRASPALPALGYGLPRLLAARYEGCGLSPPPGSRMRSGARRTITPRPCLVTTGHPGRGLRAWALRCERFSFVSGLLWGPSAERLENLSGVLESGASLRALLPLRP